MILATFSVTAPSSCLSPASKSFSDDTKPCSPGDRGQHFFSVYDYCCLCMKFRAGLYVALSCASEDPFLISELCKCLCFLDLDKHNCPFLKCEKL